MLNSCCEKLAAMLENDFEGFFARLVPEAGWIAQVIVL
jgi:hypothetical protein